MTRVLALDVGSSSIRALVHEHDARPGGDMATRKYETNRRAERKSSGSTSASQASLAGQ